MDIEKAEKKIPNAVKSAAAVMAADVLLLLGIIFLLLGIAKLLNGFIGIEGTGEGAVGVALLIIGFIILARSRVRMAFTPMPIQKPVMPQEPQKKAPSESYR